MSLLISIPFMRIYTFLPVVITDGNVIVTYSYFRKASCHNRHHRCQMSQIRIFDGEIQWFDGKYWVSAGNVKEMAKQDPFAAYEENHDTAALGDTAGTTGGDTTDGNAGQSITGGNTTGTAGGNKNSGTIQKPAATPKPMTKPSTPKPGTTKPSATPAPTATPVPAATPAPAQSNDNSSSGGSSDSGSTGGDSGSSGGSDVDMEWTPDLL